MITVKNLKKSFGDNEVLKGIDYEIKQGEKIVIIGPSGSGKSTFLRCLNLLETPTDGEIYFDGQLITDKKCDINKCASIWVWFFSILIFSIIKPYLKILLLHLFSLKL